MLIDRYLPFFDVAEVRTVHVDAPAEVTWAAIHEADLRDRIMKLLFDIREMPERLMRRLRGKPPRSAPTGKVTFGSLAQEGPGWTLLGVDPGTEFVVGSVGRFWRGDYGGRPIEADAFRDFREPGWAKLAVAFRVEADPTGGSTLRYEARTATTDDAARRRFRIYWRVIEPGVRLVMARALAHIRDEAEARVTAEGAAV